jgi:uncharacterized protein (DUF2336 family)
MIVRQLLAWARSAPPDHRAEAAAGLAGAYLGGELPSAEQRDAETALMAMLDDPSPAVRRTLAEALADSPEAPRPVIIALANDGGAVAEAVLARSPVLVDGDLIDCAALGDEPIQTAIARRPYVSVATAGALAEIAGAGALTALAANPGAEITERSLARMVERHGADPRLRPALLRRPHLPLDLRHTLMVGGPGGCPARPGSRRTERGVGDLRDRATLALAASAAPAEVERLVAHLRRTGQLTPALLLRALLSRSTVFVEAAFAELAELPRGRAAGLLHDRRGAALPSLLDRAGLPKPFRPAFAAAVAGWRVAASSGTTNAPARLSRRLVAETLSACATLAETETGKLKALLRRFEAEAVRDAARDAAEALPEPVLLALEYKPRALISADPERLQSAA